MSNHRVPVQGLVAEAPNHAGDASPWRDQLRAPTAGAPPRDGGGRDAVSGLFRVGHGDRRGIHCQLLARLRPHRLELAGSELALLPRAVGAHPGPGRLVSPADDRRPVRSSARARLLHPRCGDLHAGDADDRGRARPGRRPRALVARPRAVVPDHVRLLHRGDRALAQVGRQRRR